MTTKLILDVDTGTDDAIAIMLAALHPELDLIGVTTVNGNVPVEFCTENTLRTLEHIGRAVPVYEGARHPLLRPDLPLPRSRATGRIHGDYLNLPPARSAKQAASAVDFLVETFMSSDDEIVLVPTGPLTNVASALLAEPGLVRRIRRLVLMGGGDRVANATPAAEFNIWADPEAARIVMNSGIEDLVVIPLDATHRALVSEDDCGRLRELGSAGAAAAEIIETRINAYEEVAPMSRRRSAPVHDAVCVAYLVDPDVIQLRPAHIDVEIRGELTFGRTVLDIRPIPANEPNIRWAFDADERRFVEILLGALAPD